ncbi:MAG: PEGA domain-containing protein [Vicinamibacteria bacterium]|nr:PEGA domain-containing protein [Vicinamibacteria bacterium]
MNTLKLIGMVPLVMLAATSFGQGSDDKAVPRSSGGGSSASAGSRHSGGGSSSSSSAGQSSSSGDSGRAAAPSGRNDSNSSAQDAARRRPRPGTGTGDRDRYGDNRNSYYRSPYSSYYYDPYAYSWGYPRSRSYGLYGYGYGYYDYGYAYGDYSGYYPSASYRSYRYRSGNVAQLRTLVEPSKTRVYVDGYYAGIVDDFDGLFQRLNVSPGRHDIAFKLEGYKSHTFAVYANRDQTLKIRWDMARGNGETRDSLGEENPQSSDRDEDMDRDRDRNIDTDRDSARDREVDSDRRFEAPRNDAARGELLLDVQPLDASVYVDGEFYGKASQVTRLDLPAGRHRVEVVRPGYKTVEKEVDIDRPSVRITVNLDRR